MATTVGVMLFEDERRWLNLFEAIMTDIAREKSAKYEVRHHCTSTLDEAKRIFAQEKPQIVVSDVYIETSEITDTFRENTDAFVTAMTDLCRDEGEISVEALDVLSNLRESGYEMARHYRRDGLNFLETVRSSTSHDSLFILWSSKLFCATTRLKEVTRMKKGPDFILPKPADWEDDPELRDHLRLAIDAIGSGLWEKVRKLLPWIRPFLGGLG